MQEADFPPALLMGMEGSFGLIIALVLYFPIAPLLSRMDSSGDDHRHIQHWRHGSDLFHDEKEKDLVLIRHSSF